MVCSSDQLAPSLLPSLMLARGLYSTKASAAAIVADRSLKEALRLAVICANYLASVALASVFELARRVFDMVPDLVRDVVTWNSMISGYVQTDCCDKALKMFGELLGQISGVGPNEVTVVSTLTACGRIGLLDLGRKIHVLCLVRWIKGGGCIGYSERNGIEMNLIVKNALIDMYLKCGDIEKAFEIFCGLAQRDVYSWTAMIMGLAMNGQSERALQLFSQMEMSSDVRPNEVTFLGVLSACSHGGFVEKGFYYFDAMTQHYNLTPRLEHYGCMVDLLVRANLLVESERFIRSLPIQPDVVIWRSLIFACRNHGNIKLAEFAANQIENLEPERVLRAIVNNNGPHTICMALWTQPGVPLWFFHWMDCLQMKEFGGGLIHDFPNNLRSSARLSPEQFLLGSTMVPVFSSPLDDVEQFQVSSIQILGRWTRTSLSDLTTHGGAHHEPVLQRSDNETDVSLHHLSMHLLSHKTYELIPNSVKVIVLDVEVAVNRHFML
ncbi:hypothetical protein F0562_024489 [Nyssa sinensis]|uniref:Pentatricopeptide repeat-containing protein n=1 Tax=Nyssa sinensis TaxID=561372 RepID=A0A5J5BFJ1_9ASTE|nr:hypothetical protein F0562_024489 [Nyssa sinensis]